MRAILSGLLAGAFLLVAVPAASGELVAPKSAGAFSDSVGVTTHIVYYDTAYADWDRVVAKLEELGVKHLRDGSYGNPAPEWRDWNERYYDAVELAASRGMRFAFGMGEPGYRAGTLEQLIRVVGGRLRHAAEALEAPNEFDHFVGGPRWRSMLATYDKRLYREAKAHPSLRSLPVLGPSFGTPHGQEMFGEHGPWMDVGNIHPYTGGLSPAPDHLRSEIARGRAVSGGKPLWATEAGFHNALHATSGQAPVSEAAGAVYLLRTFLEHFDGGIRRTYAYELLDEQPDPRRRDSQQHFGLLRHDFSPKPAFTALKNLLTLVGSSDERARLRPLPLTVSGQQDGLRRLVLQKADGSYLVALWRTSSLWDSERRRPLHVAPRPLAIHLPTAGRVAAADPIVSATPRALRLRHGRVRIELAGRPLVLQITPQRLL